MFDRMIADWLTIAGLVATSPLAAQHPMRHPVDAIEMRFDCKTWEEISQRVVMQHFALEALRSVNEISSVAGPLGNLFAFGRLIERRLYARRSAATAPTARPAE